MTYILQCAVSDIVITFSNIYIWSKLFNQKVDFKKKATYIFIVLMYIGILLNYLYNNQFIRILTVTIMLSIFAKLIFKNRPYKNCLLAEVVNQILYMLSEGFFVVLIASILTLMLQI